GGEGAQLLHDVRVRLFAQKAHLVPLRVEGNLGERVARDDLRELVARPHHDVDLQPERLGDEPFALCAEASAWSVAGQHHVPALHVGRHVREACVAQHLAQPGHRNPVPGTDVDAAKQDDLTHAVGDRTSVTAGRVSRRGTRALSQRHTWSGLSSAWLTAHKQRLAWVLVAVSTLAVA